MALDGAGRFGGLNQTLEISYDSPRDSKATSRRGTEEILTVWNCVPELMFGCKLLEIPYHSEHGMKDIDEGKITQELRANFTRRSLGQVNVISSTGFRKCGAIIINS